MILPRRLFLLADGSFCEEDHPKQTMNFRPKGFIIPDAEAERLGLTAYLEKTGWGETAIDPDTPEAEHKAVTQAEVEDKAVAPPAQETKAAEPEASPEPEELSPGLHIPPEGRRGGGRAVTKRGED